VTVRSDTIRVDSIRVFEFAHDAFRCLAVPDPDASIVAEHLANANLSGHDSHGIVRLLEYAPILEASSHSTLPAAQAPILVDESATILLDAAGCLGAAIMQRATELAVSRARMTGIGTVAVRHVAHIGRLGYYADQACAEGVVVLLTSGALGRNVGITVVPGSALRIGGGNPWCFGFPRGGSEPVIVDMSSASIAEGKIRIAQLAGNELPRGLAVDRNGKETTEPEAFYDGGGVLPLGGAVAHKGLGLLIASAALGALSMIGDPEPSLAGANRPAGTSNPVLGGVFLIALDPEGFGGRDLYGGMINSCLDDLAAASREAGIEFVVPGQPEANERRSRIKLGIPINSEAVRQLNAWAAQHGIDDITG
jgi:uncharacterized oxidoreductase